MNTRELGVSIPPYLIDQIQDGRVVLVLGAGSSFGAKHPKGIDIPSGAGLASMLSEKFLGGAHSKASLATVSEMAIAQVGDPRIVFRYIAEHLRPFEPAKFHKIIPKYAWHGIATINYDEIIEKAYKAEKRHLSVGRSKDFLIEDARANQDTTILLKLHGCITTVEDQRLPLVLTRASYADHRKNRHTLYETLKTWAAERTLVFCGTSIDDSDLNQLLQELVSDYSGHPKFYLVKPDADEYESKRWSDRNIDVIKGKFEEFLRGVDKNVSGIAAGVVVPTHGHPILDAIGINPASVPVELSRRLFDRVEYVSATLMADSVGPELFYRGVTAKWGPIVNGWDIPRDISDEILLASAYNSDVNRPADLVVIRGEAGSGKTVLLRRLAWRIGNEVQKLCMWAREGSGLDTSTLEVVAPKIRDRAFLFVDDLLANAQSVVEILKRARALRVPLTVFGGARANQWNMYGHVLSQFCEDGAEHDLPSLSQREIKALLQVLDRHGCLGVLSTLSEQDRFDEISRFAERQLLVALHEATSGKPLQEIIKDEYDEIFPEEAQQLYLTVCLLNRTGTPVRAGLIARVHGITFETFERKFFAPLDRVVIALPAMGGKDVQYRARHPVIADIVVQEVLTDPERRFDQVVRLIENLNSAYASDQESLKQLTKARVLRDMFSDSHMIDQLYERAVLAAPDNGHVALQRARFEVTRDSPNFDRAAQYIGEADSLLPNNRIVQHSKAELEYQRAARSSESLVRMAALRRSESFLDGLYSRHGGPHAWHTKCKIELLRLEDVLSSNESTDEERVAAIERAEVAVAIATHRYPDDSAILDSEARLAGQLDQDERAVKALQHAARQNPRAVSVVSRLTRIYESRNELALADDLLKSAATANPAERKYHFLRAKLLMRKDSDGKVIEQLLRKSFSEGDQNHFAQFLHARQLYINGEVPEAKRRFTDLSARAGWSRRVQGKTWLWEENGKPKRLRGRVARVERWHGFIERDGTADWVFVPSNEDEEHALINASRGDSAEFEVGFTFKGPFASNIVLSH